MNNAASIKARLRNVAMKEQKPYEYILTHYMIERLLYRLSVSQYVDSFILKGGLLLHVLFADKARATRDIDFLARYVSNAPDTLKQIFSDICVIEADDAVTFDPSSITTEAITEDADYQGVRVKLVGYIERSRSTLQFDIGFGDTIVPHPEQMVYPSLLEMDETNLWVYSKESVIAEKFQAMIHLAQANSRMKDFYDLYMMATSYSFEGVILEEAVSQTLTRRATSLPIEPVIFTASFAQMKDKQTQWIGFCKRIHCIDLSFQTTLSVISHFLMPVYQSILSEHDFLLHWNPDKCCWI